MRPTIVEFGRWPMRSAMVFAIHDVLGFLPQSTTVHYHYGLEQEVHVVTLSDGMNCEFVFSYHEFARFFELGKRLEYVFDTARAQMLQHAYTEMVMDGAVWPGETGK